MTEEQVAWDVGILCDAGVETTSTTLQIFVLACVAQPHWIPTAQKELDDIVGIDRLPDFEDLKNLPYIQAVVEEVFRWHHPVPAGVPHATTQADEYKGYHIPKASIIVPFFDAMRQDKHLFDAPSEFRPERWLGTSQYGNFGYGRRICAGRHIARNSLTIAIARILLAFDIRPRGGQTVSVDEVEFTTGFVSAPIGVEAVFVPRTEAHGRVVREAFEATEKDIARLLNGVREKQVSIGLKR
jgi:cytochrome P450